MSGNNQNPLVSVVVCTYNREVFILKTLEHLLNQTASFEDFEVLFIDNNSPDNSAQICRQFISDHPEFNLSYYLETNQGHTFARNRGIAESKGNLISFIDDDAFVRKAYVAELISFFTKYPKAVAMGGKIVPLYESGSEPNWMSPHLLTLVAAIDKGNEVVQFKKGKFPIGANIAFRKSVFDTYGDFDTTLGRRGDNLEGGDEKELILRIQAKERNIYYAPKVIVDHFIPEKRVQKEYIKRMGQGVGRHERKRIRKEGSGAQLGKILSECFKWGASIILMLKYLVTGKPAKGIMLLQFRYWVFQGLMQTS